MLTFVRGVEGVACLRCRCAVSSFRVAVGGAWFLQSTSPNVDFAQSGVPTLDKRMSFLLFQGFLSRSFRCSVRFGSFIGVKPCVRGWFFSGR